MPWCERAIVQSATVDIETVDALVLRVVPMKRRGLTGRAEGRIWGH